MGKSAFSRYYFEEIWFPYRSCNLRLKSRTTHKNDGKYFYISSGSQSPSTSDLIYSSLDKLMIKLKEFIAFSSMVFILLNMKLEQSNIASRKILVSWFTSSSKAPMPSLSITKLYNFSPLYSVSIVYDHTHSPFVHGLMVGPTPNPSFFLLRITLLSKNDFPVLYFPATAITPTFSLILLKN